MDDREAAEKKIKRDARRNVADYKEVVLTTLPPEAYAKVVGPDAKAAGTLTEPRAFNLMLVHRRRRGPGRVSRDIPSARKRPKASSSNFKNVVDTTRVKVPFGIAQVGKIVPQRSHAAELTFSGRGNSSRWRWSFSARPTKR